LPEIDEIKINLHRAMNFVQPFENGCPVERERVHEYSIDYLRVLLLPISGHGLAWFSSRLHHCLCDPLQIFIVGGRWFISIRVG